MLPGIDGGELIVIAIVALVVVGPKDLPKMLRKLGQVIGKMRRMAEGFREAFDDMGRQSELEDLKREVDALKATGVTTLASTGAEITASLAHDSAGAPAPRPDGPLALEAPNADPPPASVAGQTGNPAPDTSHGSSDADASLAHTSPVDRTS